MRSKIAKDHSHVDEDDVIYCSLYSIVTIIIDEYDDNCVCNNNYFFELINFVF